MISASVVFRSIIGYINSGTTALRFLKRRLLGKRTHFAVNLQQCIETQTNERYLRA